MAKSKYIPKSKNAEIKKVASNPVQSEAKPMEANHFNKELKALLSVPKP